MLTTATNFSCATLCLFCLVRLGIPENTKNGLISLSTLFWTIYYGCLVYSTAHMGHFARREVKLKLMHLISSIILLKNSGQQALKTAAILHKIANQDESEPYKKDILLFSQQLLHRAPEFSCGLFVFDLSLAFKVFPFLCYQINFFTYYKLIQMISAVAVYLIILIQFTLAGNSSQNAQHHNITFP